MKATVAASAVPLLASLVSPALGALQARDFHAKQKRFGIKALDNPYLDLVGNGTFEQNLDHNDLGQGTFEQRYWWDASHYKDGGPVFVFNPGETSADRMMGYLSNATLPGRYAQEFNGAVILIEHRYWGESIPFTTLTAETLQYLNLPNAMKDMTNFALNANLEFCNDGKCNADSVPWVLTGGSYSGALAAWTSHMEPGVFAAYHASSAVVEAIYDFWMYFDPIEEALPRNCSNDVKAVIKYVDEIFASGDEADIKELKAMFNLDELNGADFADTLANPLSNWQSDQDAVLEFCDYIETHGGTTQAMLHSETGVGLSSALSAYAYYINYTEHVQCGPGGSACNSYASNILWNTPDQLDEHRPWQWMLCNEPFGFWQVGPEVSDGTNIVSSQMRPEHYQRRCPLIFPETNGYVSGSVAGWTEEHLNMWNDGWDAKFEKVIFVDGQFDPWRSATLSSDFRPGGKVNSTEIPVYIVESGVHTPELWIDETNPHTWPIVQSAMAQMATWLSEWKPPTKTY